MLCLQGGAKFPDWRYSPRPAAFGRLLTRCNSGTNSIVWMEEDECGKIVCLQGCASLLTVHLGEVKGSRCFEPYKEAYFCFETLYKKYLRGSYNKYSHEDTEIIIAVTAKFAEIWDTSEDNYAYQIFPGFDKEIAEVKQYDQE